MGHDAGEAVGQGRLAGGGFDQADIGQEAGDPGGAAELFGGGLHVDEGDGGEVYVDDVQLFAASPVTVADHSFEGNEWNFNLAGVTEGGNPAGYVQSDGENPGTMWQNFYLTPGIYEFGFSMATDPGNTQGITIHWDGEYGSSVGTWSATDTWTDHTSTQFTVSSAGIYSVYIQSTSTEADQIAYIDNFKLYSVGGPGTFYMDIVSSDWTFYIGNAGVVEDLGDSEIPAGFGGGKVAALESTDVDPAGLSQGVYFAVGTYELSFGMAERAGDTQGVDIHVGDTDVGSFGATEEWETYTTASFVISEAGTYTLSFGTTTTPGAFGGSYNRAFLDDITLYENVDLESEITRTQVASQRIVTAYNSLGLVDTVTSYDDASAGTVVNQVKRVYNGFGQVTAEYQQHDDTTIVTSGTAQTMHVGYTYDTAAHGSRLTGEIYPQVGTESGYTLTYSYGTSNALNDTIGRLDAMKEGSLVLEGYKYLGLGTVVERDEGEEGPDHVPPPGPMKLVKK